MIDATLRIRRRTMNAVAMAGATTLTACGLAVLGFILFSLLQHGLAAMGPALFIQSTSGPGSTGGLANAIIGSLAMAGLGIAIALPVGLMAGTYLVEYSRGGLFGKVLEFINDMLLSAPSIIIGLFVYQLLVVPVHHFSGYAGAVSLAIIAIPVIVRTTRDMLQLVPNGLREAAFALGAPKWKMITVVAYRAAFQGLLTGMLLALASISGETAPLLFTALGNQFFSTNMAKPMASLPQVIFQFAMSADEGWHQLAWSGALLITVAVLATNIIARAIAGFGQRAAR